MLSVSAEVRQDRVRLCDEGPFQPSVLVGDACSRSTKSVSLVHVTDSSLRVYTMSIAYVWGGVDTVKKWGAETERGFTGHKNARQIRAFHCISHLFNNHHISMGSDQITVPLSIPIPIPMGIPMGNPIPRQPWFTGNFLSKSRSPNVITSGVYQSTYFYRVILIYNDL